MGKSRLKGAFNNGILLFLLPLVLPPSAWAIQCKDIGLSSQENQPHCKGLRAAEDSSKNCPFVRPQATEAFFTYQYCLSFRSLFTEKVPCQNLGHPNTEVICRLLLRGFKKDDCTQPSNETVPLEQSLNLCNLGKRIVKSISTSHIQECQSVSSSQKSACLPQAANLRSLQHELKRRYIALSDERERSPDRFSGKESNQNQSPSHAQSLPALIETKTEEPQQKPPQSSPEFGIFNYFKSFFISPASSPSSNTSAVNAAEKKANQLFEILSPVVERYKRFNYRPESLKHLLHNLTDLIAKSPQEWDRLTHEQIKKKSFLELSQNSRALGTDSLPLSITFTPEGRRIIHLGTLNDQLVPIGEGASKVVTLSIDYDTGELISYGKLKESTPDIQNELSLLMELKGKPGIAQTLGFYNHPNPVLLQHFYPYHLAQYRETLKDLTPKALNEKTLDVAVQLLTGLKTIHRLGILHKDIKPENILIEIAPSQQLTAVINDFGVSRKWNDQTSEGAASFYLGSIVSTSPENFRAIHEIQDMEYKKGDSAQKLPQSYLKAQTLLKNNITNDIWAMGIAFYYLLYGSYPGSLTSANHPHSAIQALTKVTDLPSLYRFLNFGPELSPPPVGSLERILVQMLHPDYRQRPTADQALKMIQSIQMNLHLSHQ